MPGRRYIVFPQGGGSTKPPYNPGADPTILNNHRPQFNESKTILTYQQRRLVTSAGVTAPPTPPSGVLGVGVSGTNLINTLNGQTIQLKGWNTAFDNRAFTGMEASWWTNAAIPLTGGRPNWTAYRNQWPATMPAGLLPFVRYASLCEADILGLSTKSPDGTTYNYATNGPANLAILDQDVSDITGLGMAVSLNLYWAAPNNGGVPMTPFEQAAMVNRDNSINFWRFVANRYKSNPLVMYEIFNEPYFGTYTAGNGGTSSASSGASPPSFLNTDLTHPSSFYITNGGAPGTYLHSDQNASTVGASMFPVNWVTAGLQECVNAIRGTGAPNVIILGGDGYDYQTDGLTSFPVSDTLNPPQLCATQHWYNNANNMDSGSNSGNPGTSTGGYSLPTTMPIFLTEIGNLGSNDSNFTLRNVDSHGWSAAIWGYGNSSTSYMDFSTLRTINGRSAYKPVSANYNFYWWLNNGNPTNSAVPPN